MPSELHEQLCLKAVTWLKSNGFGVAAMNVWAFGSRERADCIGFRQQCSVLIEVKVSRADFFADRKKPERVAGGFGNYRFYLAPAGLLNATDLPKGWGLLEYQRKVELVHGPSGNLWPSVENALGTHWQEFVHASCPVAERSFLYTLARK
jgi:hypothetical protein